MVIPFIINSTIIVIIIDIFSIYWCIFIFVTTIIITFIIIFIIIIIAIWLKNNIIFIVIDISAETILFLWS